MITWCLTHQLHFKKLSQTNVLERQLSRVNSRATFLKSQSFLDQLDNLSFLMRLNMHFTVSISAKVNIVLVLDCKLFDFEGGHE